MDCEKFENLLIDELYGELDEVTSAAVRRHAAGCARCGALLSGLRATRKVAALPMEEPSIDLEDRILSAVREQQKVLPFRARAATALSRAGAWAMRPQTAMAAVFLVVIGTSFVLVQSRGDKSMHAAAQNAEGMPMSVSKTSPAGAAASAYVLDGNESAFAHGLEEKHAEAPRAVATAIPPAMMPDEDLAKDKDNKKEEREQTLAMNGRDDLKNAGPIAGATRSADLSPGGGGGSAGGYFGNGQAQAAQTQAPYASGGASFGTAKQLYDQRRFDDARTQWDALGPTDANAVLWAGRAEKAKNGCTPIAIQHFDAASQRAMGTAIGDQATLEAGNCYKQTNTALARARYSSLLGRGGTIAVTAQAELDSLTPTAARKASAHEAAPAHPATVLPQATATTSQGQPAQKAADSY